MIIGNTGRSCNINICYFFIVSVRGALMPDITQIAAVDTESGVAFNTYVTPSRHISSEAQRVTGITVNSVGQMYVQGQSVESMNVGTAIDQLCEWLKKFPNPVLIAHNGRRFDFPVLMSCLMEGNAVERF